MAPKRKSPAASAPVRSSKRRKASTTALKSPPSIAIKGQGKVSKAKIEAKKTKKSALQAKQTNTKTKTVAAKKAKVATSKKGPARKTPPAKKKIAVKAKPAITTAAPVPAPATPKKSPGGKKTDQEIINILNDLATTARTSNITASYFNELSVNDFKKALRHNDRSSTGNRADLVKSVIDYMTNGCPPRCPKCGGGRLRYSMKDGKKQYWCPGFMEDTDFVNCDYKSAQATRIPWKQLQ